MRIVRDRAVVVMWLLLGAWVCAIVARGWNGSAYSPDSWAYWDMAQRIQEGAPFTMRGIRQFQTEATLAVSFPPLYPALLALVDLLTGFGWRTGLVLNAGAVLGSAVALDRAVTDRASPIGAAVVLCASAWPPLANEVASGRSMPVALLFAAAVVWSLAEHRTAASPAKRWTGAGAAAAALVLTRFDGLPILLGFPVLALVVQSGWRARLVKATAWGIGAALVLLPAVLVSYRVVGAPFMSDNRRTALMVASSHVTSYLPGPVPTIVDAPAAWMGRVLSNLDGTLSAAAAAAIDSLLFAAVLVGLLLAWDRGPRRAASRGRRDRDAASDPPWVITGALLGASILSVVVGNVTTGYHDDRYWALPVVVVLYVVGRWMRDAPLDPPRRVRALSVLVASLVLSGHLVGFAGSGAAIDPGRSLVEGDWTPSRRVLGTAVAGDVLPEWLRCVDQGVVLELDDAVAAARVPALTDKAVALRPRNLDELSQQETEVLLERYDVTYVRSERSGEVDSLSQVVELESTGCDGLFRIRSRGPAARGPSLTSDLATGSG